MRSKLWALLLTFCVTLSFSVDAQQQLANYIGTGTNPRIKLELSPNNGPGWGSFTIDYQGVGGVPYSSDSSKNWSPWNVIDQDGNYYGTITLTSNGKTVEWSTYTAGTDGRYLEGIVFSYNSGIKAYQLSAAKIHGGASKGPFPNAPLATPAVYPGTSERIILSVSGDTIVNNKGVPIVLKGIVRPSLEWNPQGQFLSPEDLRLIRGWGSNVIRLDLNQNYWFESGPVTEKGSYKQIINAIVEHSIKDQMSIILDLHWTENGHQSPMANHDSILFWKQVAADYKDFGTVIFELFNEPESITSSVWLNGSTQYAGYQLLYDAVRGTGAQNICIVNGLDYGYDLSFVSESFKVTGHNIVYGSHPYNEKGKDGWNGPGGSFANNFKGVLGIFPLIFTEFGVNQSNYFPTGYKAVYDRILGYADTHKISYSAFAWWVENDPNKANVFPCVIKDWSGTPLNGGVQIHKDIMERPGTPINSK